MKYKHLIFALACAVAAACSTNNEPQPGPGPDPEPQPEPIDSSLYAVAQIIIDTNGAPIVSKEDYIDCTFELQSEVKEWNFAKADAQIRGRGNSTWLWYDKKPYRIKLKKKASLMGMGEGKSWVLLANYRDPTHIMNSYVFTLGNMLEMPFTNHVHYAEVNLNGEYIGFYQLTEQVQQGDGRVAIDEKAGYLLSLDLDDGPDLSPGAGDNFYSSVYKMPVCVKNPENLTQEGMNAIRDDFAVLESAIRGGDFDQVQTLLDVQTFIDFLIIQELVYNVELEAPRSMYIHKDVNGLWTMGPLWDFDAGFDFDWSTMYTGHNYFKSYRKLVMGTNPATHQGAYCNPPRFFTDLFKVEAFKQQYKERWKEVFPLTEAAFEEVLLYIDDEAMQRNQDRWPIGKSYSTEIDNMRIWLENRRLYLDSVIKNY